MTEPNVVPASAVVQVPRAEWERVCMLLRQLEWAESVDHGDHVCRACRMCSALEYQGHGPGCELAAALAARNA